MHGRQRFSFVFGSLLLAGSAIAHAMDTSSQGAKSRTGSPPPPANPLVAWTNEAVVPRLYEGQRRYDVIYGTVNTFTPPAQRNLSVGIQKSQPSGIYTLVGCDATGGASPPVFSGDEYSFAGCTAP